MVPAVADRPTAGSGTFAPGLQPIRELPLVVDLEVDDLDSIIVGEHHEHRKMGDQHSRGDQHPNLPDTPDFHGGRLVVNGEEVDEWRDLVEKKIGRRGDAGGTPLFGKQFVEPVEE